MGDQLLPAVFKNCEVVWKFAYRDIHKCKTLPFSRRPVELTRSKNKPDLSLARSIRQDILINMVPLYHMAAYSWGSRLRQSNPFSCHYAHSFDNYIPVLISTATAPQ